tara:strand:- start:10120 stop:10953 length:834 start_codon:yes stop_codon:yes gene_type:complete
MTAEEAGSSEVLDAESAWGQIIGTRKTQQDDAAIVNWPNGFSLSMLADGMGGHAGGAEASQLVVNTFRQHFIDSTENNIRQRFLSSLSAANLAVFDYTQQHPELEGMGATFLAVVFDGASIQWISVGDSPLWLFRNDEITRLNENHSMSTVLAKQVAEGLISAEEAATSPERSQLLEAVLGKDIKLLDAPEESFPVQEGDIIILASDGVETCSLDELQVLLSTSTENPDCNAEALIEAILSRVDAHQRASQDNSTLNIIRIVGVQDSVNTVPAGKEK